RRVRRGGGGGRGLGALEPGPAGAALLRAARFLDRAPPLRHRRQRAARDGGRPSPRRGDNPVLRPAPGLPLRRGLALAHAKAPFARALLLSLAARGALSIVACFAPQGHRGARWRKRSPARRAPLAEEAAAHGQAFPELGLGEYAQRSGETRRAAPSRM